MRSSWICWAGPPLLGTLDVPDAGDLLPAARGHLHVDWRVAGPGLSAASVAIDGGDLAYGDIAAAGVTGRFDIDRPRNRLRLRVDAPDVAIGDQKLALHVTADGTAVDHAFDSTLTRNGATLDLRGRGNVLRTAGARGSSRARCAGRHPPPGRWMARLRSTCAATWWSSNATAGAPATRACARTASAPRACST